MSRVKRSVFSSSSILIVTMLASGCDRVLNELAQGAVLTPGTFEDFNPAICGEELVTQADLVTAGVLADDAALDGQGAALAPWDRFIAAYFAACGLE
jgi:hypothetical protein